MKWMCWIWKVHASQLKPGLWDPTDLSSNCNLTAHWLHVFAKVTQPLSLSLLLYKLGATTAQFPSPGVVLRHDEIIP